MEPGYEPWTLGGLYRHGCDRLNFTTGKFQGYGFASVIQSVFLWDAVTSRIAYGDAATGGSAFGYFDKN